MTTFKFRLLRVMFSNGILIVVSVDRDFADLGKMNPSLYDCEDYLELPLRLVIMRSI